MFIFEQPSSSWFNKDIHNIFIVFYVFDFSINLNKFFFFILQQSYIFSGQYTFIHKLYYVVRPEIQIHYSNLIINPFNSTWILSFISYYFTIYSRISLSRTSRWVTRQLPLLEQELFTIPEHPSSELEFDYW